MTTLIKNPKGRIVSVTPERKKYLLDPNPVALKINGQPKEDANGNKTPLIKAEHEKGWTDPTAAEIAAFEAEEEAGREAAEEVEDAEAAAALATRTAAKLAADASKGATSKPAKAGPGRKTNAQKAKEEEEAAEAAAKAKAAELEATVRAAEGDPEKYKGLDGDGKKLYLELFKDEPAF